MKKKKFSELSALSMWGEGMGNRAVTGSAMNLRSGTSEGAWYNLPPLEKDFNVTADGMYALFAHVIITLSAESTSTDTVIGRTSFCVDVCTGAPGTCWKGRRERERNVERNWNRKKEIDR